VYVSCREYADVLRDEAAQFAIQVVDERSELELVAEGIGLVKRALEDRVL
jgi:hypothetical protein